MLADFAFLGGGGLANFAFLGEGGDACQFSIFRERGECWPILHF